MVCWVGAGWPGGAQRERATTTLGEQLTEEDDKLAQSLGASWGAPKHGAHSMKGGQRGLAGWVVPKWPEELSKEMTSRWLGFSHVEGG